MSYAPSRSMNSALHTGISEGGLKEIGKDWGGVPGDRVGPDHDGGCGPGCSHWLSDPYGAL